MNRPMYPNYHLLDDDHLVASAHQLPDLSALERELLKRFESAPAIREAVRDTGWDDENSLDALPGVLNVLNDFSITDADELRRALNQAA